MKLELRPGFAPFAGENVPDLRILIDVFRASTTALAILENGADTLEMTNDLGLLQNLSRQGYLVVSEVFDLGIDNSPSLVKSHGILKRNVVQKTSNLTMALEQNFAQRTLIGCFNNFQAIVQYIFATKYQHIEIVPAGYMESKKMNFEDWHCAQILRDSILLGHCLHPDSPALQRRIDELTSSGNHPPHYLQDLQLAIRTNTSTIIPFVRKISHNRFKVSAEFADK